MGKLGFYKIEIERTETERETLRKKLITLVAPQPLPELTRENVRAQVIEDVKAAWKLSGTQDELNLIVLDADSRRQVFKSELLKIFPESVEHYLRNSGRAVFIQSSKTEQEKFNTSARQKDLDLTLCYFGG